jgi:hypothetical protein
MHVIHFGLLLVLPIVSAVQHKLSSSTADAAHTVDQRRLELKKFEPGSVEKFDTGLKKLQTLYLGWKSAAEKPAKRAELDTALHAFCSEFKMQPGHDHEAVARLEQYLETSTRDNKLALIFLASGMILVLIGGGYFFYAGPGVVVYFDDGQRLCPRASCCCCCCLAYPGAAAKP